MDTVHQLLLSVIILYTHNSFYTQEVFTTFQTNQALNRQIFNKPCLLLAGANIFCPAPPPPQQMDDYSLANIYVHKYTCMHINLCKCCHAGMDY